MNNRRALIEIELKSDLCVGSGYSYAGIIDSDVCYNEQGLPFIPAKRIKGCLRETAEFIYPEFVDQIFGVTGKANATGITLDNATIRNYEQINKELKSIIKSEKKEMKNINAQSVLECYTSVRAQTKIDNDGVAENNSLRFMRVINQYDPLKEKEPMKFFAEITFNKEYETELGDIIQATRKFGLNRNRGLGCVKCQLISIENQSKSFINQDKSSGKQSIEIQYCIKNSSPIILSDNNSQETKKYISGQSVLGKMAGMYLSMTGKSAEEQEFQDLFLNGSTQFSNLYPLKEETVQEQTIPAPLFIQKMKKSKQIVNVLDWEEINNLMKKDYGDTPKKMNGKFVTFENDKLTINETDVENVYHMSKNSESEKGEKRLFMLEAMKAEQFFAGTIRTDSKYERLISSLLEHCDLRFGKSKASQYGKCELVYKKSKPATSTKITSQTIIVAFSSDAIFIDNEKGLYTTDFLKVKKLLGEELGITDYKSADEESMYQTTVTGGYHSVWNLKRASVPAIKAGSFFVYQLPVEKEVTNPVYVGERTLEGFGQVQVWSREELKSRYEIKNIELNEDCKVDKSKALCVKILMKYLVDVIMNEDMKNRKAIEISPSTLGRVTLMLKESSEGKQCANEMFEDFQKRVQSVKREAQRKEIISKIMPIVAVKKMDDSNYELSFERANQISLEVVETLDKMIGSEKRTKLLMNHWVEILMNYLIYQKYNKS